MRGSEEERTEQGEEKPEIWCSNHMDSVIEGG